EVVMGIESSDGRCRTFSAEASGTGAGEALVAVVLKDYEAAVRDGDHVYGIIKGSAVNQDAALSANLAAPDAWAQSEVIQKAWEQAGVNPAEVSFIECHGTGTKLGDPIEIEGIKKAFAAQGVTPQGVHVSAVKTNLGHANSAAGLVSLVKVLLSLEHQVLFPNVHYTQPNPLIDLGDGQLVVTDALTPWKGNPTRIAGISSFGMIGTNCHVVVAEAPAVAAYQEEGAYPFVLSAKDEDSLERNRAALLAHLKQETHVDLPSLSSTLLRTRTEYPLQIRWSAEDLDACRQALEQAPVVEAGEVPENVFLLLSHFEGIDGLPGWAEQVVREHTTITETQLLGAKSQPLARAFLVRLAYLRTALHYALETDQILADGNGKIVVAFHNGTMSF
ncbi:MAG TPA: hypothetical protein DCR93_33270, partial [Cytophagales bacterium]|nr:hypothetical protein [Cytophagales bacterium]